MIMALLNVSCQRSNTQSRYAKIKIAHPIHFTPTTKEILQQLKLSHKELQTQLQRHLKAAGDYQLIDTRKDAPDGYVLRVNIGVNPMPPELDEQRQVRRFRHRLMVRYELIPFISQREIQTIQTIKDFAHLPEAKPSPEVLQNMIRELWTKSYGSLEMYGKLKRTTTSELLAKLTNNPIDSQKGDQKRRRADLDFRYHATRILGQRGESKAAKAMIGQLQTDEPELLLVTIGSLARLREPQAVQPLIALAQKSDGAFLAQILSALAEIGGEEAKSFLFTLANAHSLAEIRQTASEALEELKQRDRAKTAKQPQQRDSPEQTKQTGGTSK
jgi:hypothetical protein